MVYWHKVGYYLRWWSKLLAETNSMTSNYFNLLCLKTPPWWYVLTWLHVPSALDSIMGHLMNMYAVPLLHQYLSIYRPIPVVALVTPAICLFVDDPGSAIPDCCHWSYCFLACTNYWGVCLVESTESSRYKIICKASQCFTHNSLFYGLRWG